MRSEQLQTIRALAYARKAAAKDAVCSTSEAYQRAKLELVEAELAFCEITKILNDYSHQIEKYQPGYKNVPAPSQSFMDKLANFPEHMKVI